MIRRFLFFSLLAFWLVMNALLWRHEVVGLDLGSPVDPQMVFQRILEAPDDSSMEIMRREQSLGFSRFRPRINEEFIEEYSDDFVPEEMVTQRVGYTLNLEGRVLTDNAVSRFRYNFTLELDKESQWSSGSFVFWVGKDSLEILMDIESGLATFVMEREGLENQNWSLPFSELLNINSLIARINLPMIDGLSGLEALQSASHSETMDLKWEAWSGWLDISHAKMRVYRLRVKLFDVYEITLTVSRGGEILVVELPNDIRVVNEVIGN